MRKRNLCLEPCCGKTVVDMNGGRYELFSVCTLYDYLSSLSLSVSLSLSFSLSFALSSWVMCEQDTALKTNTAAADRHGLLLDLTAAAATAASPLCLLTTCRYL
eukprot:sb/3478070/